jgi:hypothetical protein
MTRRVAAGMAIALAAALVAGCLGGQHRDHGAAPRAAARHALPTTALRLVQLHPLNGSGVRGAVRVLLRGRQVSVESFTTGAVPGRVHMQHIHVPPGGADGTCPTAAMDANGDGFVSLKEGLGAYGPPAVSLTPFPKVDSASWDYAGNLPVPAGLALDRGVIVLHGMWVHGHYDELMPIACGVIGDALTREVPLDPVNDSSIAGTARVALAGSNLYVWVSLGGRIAGHMHMQHIHLPKGNGRGRCPTRDLDRNGDGLVSLAEGLPAYGAPAVSLEPFPMPTGLRYEYSRTLHVRPGLPIDRGVIVVHGMEVHGRYDDTIPVACGAISPALPEARAVQPGAAPATGVYGARGQSGGAPGSQRGY